MSTPAPSARGRSTVGSSGPGYRERLWPSWWVWLVVLGLAASFGVVVARFSGRWALVTVGIAAALLGSLLLSMTGRIAVEAGTLLAGRARVPLDVVGRVEVLDPAAMRTAHGPDLDARAYLFLRGWVTRGVRVRLNDPNDPTPYWLVSTRSPAALAAAVEAARPAAR